MANKKSSGTDKKCRKCSLDCEVLRMRAMINVPVDKRKEYIKANFVNEKPAYTRSTCPK
jgi:hypothetical protein